MVARLTWLNVSNAQFFVPDVQLCKQTRLVAIGPWWGDLE